MINPHLAADLRHARHIFRKRGQFNLAAAAHTTLGDMADSMNPPELGAHNLINLAFGGPIHA